MIQNHFLGKNMKLVRQFLRSLAALFVVALLSSCGGGGSSDDPSSVKGLAETSTRLVDDWFTTANQNKINSYNSDRSMLVFQYATSVGARVSGNSAIIVGSRQAFSSRTTAMLNGFKSFTTDTARSYEIDKSAISDMLSRYEASDITFIGTSLSGIDADAGFVVSTQSDIRSMYDSARQFVQAL